MRTLTLTLNIGNADAARLKLKKTLEGETLQVNDDAAAELLNRGWAVEATGLKSTPPEPPASSSSASRSASTASSVSTAPPPHSAGKKPNAGG